MAFTFKIVNFKTAENGLEIDIEWNGTPQSVVVPSGAAAINFIQQDPPDVFDLMWIALRCWQAHDANLSNPNLIKGKTLTFDPSSTTSPMTLA